jgi:hypothetical protein
VDHENRDRQRGGALARHPTWREKLKAREREEPGASVGNHRMFFETYKHLTREPVDYLFCFPLGESPPLSVDGKVALPYEFGSIEGAR